MNLYFLHFHSGKHGGTEWLFPSHHAHASLLTKVVFPTAPYCCALLLNLPSKMGWVVLFWVGVFFVFVWLVGFLFVLRFFGLGLFFWKKTMDKSGTIKIGGSRFQAVD